MIIKRMINGVETEITLTNRELWEAFVEEQHKCDLSDIDNAFEDLIDDELIEDYGKTRSELEELKEAMAYKYRKFRDNYDESWIEDRDAAIRYVLMENEKYVQLVDVKREAEVENTYSTFAFRLMPMGW